MAAAAAAAGVSGVSGVPRVASAQCGIESRVPPPSYAEAMGYPDPMKDNIASVSQTYEQYPQVSSYQHSQQGYSSQSNFYPTPHNPSTLQNPSIQPNQDSPIHCIVHAEHVVRRKSRPGRTGGTIICTGIFGVVVMIFMVRLIFIHASI